MSKKKIYKAAQKFAKKGQWDRAIAEYRKILESDPAEKNVHNTIGDLLIKKADYRNAIKEYRLEAEKFEKEGFIPQAVALYKKILRIEPDNPDNYLALAKLYSNQGHVRDAVKNNTKAIDGYIDNRNYQKALEVTKEVSNIVPGNFEIKRKLAELNAQQGNIEEAVGQFCEIAEYYNKNGDIENAGEQYKRAIELAPEEEEVIIGYTTFLIELKRFKEVYPLLKEYLKKNKDNLQGLYLLGKAFYHDGKDKKAEKTIERILEIDPSQFGVREMLGELKLRKNKVKEALEQFGILAEKYIEQEEYNLAEELIQKIIETDPKFIEAREKMSDIYHRQDKNDLVQEQLLEIANIYKGKKDFLRAKRTCERLLKINANHPKGKKMMAELEKKDLDDTGLDMPEEEELISEPVNIEAEHDEPVQDAAENNESSSGQFDLNESNEENADAQELTLEEMAEIGNEDLESIELDEGKLDEPTEEQDSTVTENEEIDVQDDEEILDLDDEEIDEQMEFSNENEDFSDIQLDEEDNNENLTSGKDVEFSFSGEELESSGTNGTGIEENLEELDIEQEDIQESLEDAEEESEPEEKEIIELDMEDEIVMEEEDSDEITETTSADDDLDELESEMLEDESDIQDVEDIALEELNEEDLDDDEQADEIVEETGSDQDVIENEELEEVSEDLEDLEDEEEIIDLDEEVAEELSLEEPNEEEIELDEELEENNLDEEETEEEIEEISEEDIEIDEDEAMEVELEEEDEVEDLSDIDFEDVDEESLDEEDIDMEELEDLEEEEIEEEEVEDTSDLSEKEKIKEVSIFLKYGLTSKAIQQLKDIIEKNPDSIEANEKLVSILKTQKKKKELIKYQLELANKYEENDKIQKARATYEDILKVDSRNKTAKSKLKSLPEIEETVEPVEEITEVEEKLEDENQDELIEMEDEEIALEEETGNEKDMVMEEEAEEAEEVEEDKEVEEEETGQDVEEDKAVEKAKTTDILKELDSLAKVTNAGTRKSTQDDEEEFSSEDEKEKEVEPVEETLESEDKESKPTLFGKDAFFNDENEEKEVSTAEVIIDEDLSEVTEEQKIQDGHAGVGEVKEQIDAEDFETHYNLGIAYKEMGLLDKAIGEFILASRDPNRFLDSCNMLGLCYLEKGDPKKAIREFKRGLDTPGHDEMYYLELRYGLGKAYEMMGNTSEAFDAYMEIYGVDAKFRDVADRMKKLKK